MANPNKLSKGKVGAGIVGAAAVVAFGAWGQGAIESATFTPTDAAHTVEEEYGVRDAKVVDTDTVLPAFRGCFFYDSVRYDLQAVATDGTIDEFKLCTSILPFDKPNIDEK